MELLLGRLIEVQFDWFDGYLFFDKDFQLKVQGSFWVEKTLQHVILRWLIHASNAKLFID